MAYCISAGDSEHAEELNAYALSDKRETTTPGPSLGLEALKK